ncbi:MAG: hypothetical protein K9H16_12450, partial [Bacteroidales bacterium]|nr:hypothetical protein [Bacteroidales bacterium]
MKHITSLWLLMFLFASTAMFAQVASSGDDPAMVQYKMEQVRLNAAADVQPGVIPGSPQTTGNHYSKYISSDASRAILWDNGGFVTAEGVGSGGSDYSELQDASLGMGTYGSGAQLTAGNSIADDFDVVGGWNVVSFTFFAYQTGSGPPSTLTGVYVQVYDGNPSAGGSLIWGDLTTNRMLSTTWTNAWRVLESGPSENRPIMNIVADASGLSLSAGTYWVEMSLTGSGASGPWAPPVTLVGETTTGNSIQKTSTGWAPLVDIGPQGLPFIVEGTAGAPPTNDVGVFAIPQPVSGVDLTNAEPVTITIKNSGTAAQSNVPYMVTWDGPTGSQTVNGTYTGSIAAGATVDVTLSQTADLSVYGDYAFEACTQLAGDEYAGNDCKTKTVTNAFPAYCAASTTTEDEYIANVLCGTIDNTSGWQGGVADYTAFSTAIAAGAAEAITVTNGNPWASDIVYCWVDWNSNWVYEQATDEEYILTSDGTGLTFTGDITVPAGTPEGDYRMRIRMTYSTAPVPCGSASYGEIEEYTIQVGEGGGPVGNPPENFTAVYTEDIGVECNWEYSPGTWVGYDDGFNNDGLGLNGGGTFWGAIRWDAADLAGFDGWYMSSFKFFPRLFATPATMKFMIWEGADAANLVYEQVLSGLTWDEWNEIALNEMHMIDASMDLWIGIEVTHVDAEYPLGYDAGPAVAGYGDMVSLDGSTWASMSNEWGLDYNFNLKGLLVENADGIVGNKTVLAQNTISNPTGVLAAGNLKPAVNPAGSRAFLGFNVYRDGEQVNAAIITDNSYIDVYSTPGTYMYTAKTVYDEGLSDPTPEVEVIITGEPNPVVVFEPFEDYTAGGYLVQQAVAQGKSYWTTWSNAPGTAEDPFVSSAQAYAGNNSVVIEGTNDAVLLLDNYTEGVFNVDFRIYIPSGKIGYFNMLQLFNGASSQWGMQAYFDVDGAGLVDAGAAGAGVFTYTYDTWHNVSVDVDLDADWAEMFLNGTSIVAWQWSTGSFGTGTLNAFNAMNFYAWAENGTPGAFFDNIDITMGGEPMAPEIAVNPTSLNESHTTPPQVTTKTLTITNTGTETLNWDITLDLGGTDASIVPYYNEAEAIRVLEERLAAEGKTFSSPAYIKANEPGNATDAITCPPDALISQPAVNFATAYTMDEDAGYTVYQSFTGAGDIGGIRFWTISAFFDGAAWGPCDGIDPRPFDIGFWQDAGGSVGANIATYEGIELTRTATGDLFAGTYPIYEYTAEFDAVTVEAGWFSIQSMIGTAVNCWNLALNQPGGAGNCLQYDGAAWTAQPDPLGFCLIEGIATVYANDVSISSIVQPASGVDLTNAEPVTIKIKNNGTTTQTSIPWTVTWDGPTGAQTASGTYAGSLVQGATVDVTLTQTADLSIYGDYTFEACTGLAGDENAANDCKTKVVVNAMPVYCDASTTTEDEWIANVLCGSIDNSSGWQGGVADYTAISTEIGVGASEAITITNGNAWASDIVTCWVDWNMNYTFEQGTDEEFFTTNVGGTGLTFTGNITVPEGTSGGAYRMRVRMTYSTAPVPCGNASYGEIEDYTIVVPGGPATDWLAVDLTTGSVEPGQSQVVTVTFNSTGLAMDTYVGSINIASNAATNPMVMVPATLNVGMAPVIAVSPAQIDEVHPTPPQMTTKTLSITNNGSSVLNWDIALNLGGTDASIVPYFDHAEALRVLEERLSAEGSALSADVEPGVSAGQPQTSGDHYSKHISSDASRAIL